MKRTRATARPAPLRVTDQISASLRDLFATAMLLGISKGELFDALKADVNRSDRTIRVGRSHSTDQTKTDEQRWLPIPAALWPFIEHALDKSAMKLEQKLRSALSSTGASGWNRLRG